MFDHVRQEEEVEGLWLDLDGVPLDVRDQDPCTPSTGLPGLLWRNGDPDDASGRFL
jgi:hypothetical protein